MVNDLDPPKLKTGSVWEDPKGRNHGQHDPKKACKQRRKAMAQARSPQGDGSSQIKQAADQGALIAHDPLQWVLQRYQGRWRDRSFCVTHAGLLRCILHEHRGQADLPEVTLLPPWHPDRELLPCSMEAE